MKALFNPFALSVLIATAACQTVPTPPVATQAVTVSKQTVIAANRLYTRASRAGMTLVVSGLWDKAAYQRADNEAYALLLKVRSGQATLAQLTAAAAILSGGK